MQRRDQAGIASNEDPGRSKKDSAHVADHTAELVPAWVEVEVNRPRPNFAVIGARRSAGHENIAEVDARSSDNRGGQDRVLEADIVPDFGVLFEKSSGTQFGEAARLG